MSSDMPSLLPFHQVHGDLEHGGHVGVRLLQGDVQVEGPVVEIHLGEVLHPEERKKKIVPYHRGKGKH